MQILRLILAGVLDRYPNLQVVTGYWDEVALFYFDRIDDLAPVAKLDRLISEYFKRHVSVTPSGIWSLRYLRWAIEVLGIDRIMFLTDHPTGSLRRAVCVNSPGYGDGGSRQGRDRARELG